MAELSLIAGMNYLGQEKKQIKKNAKAKKTNNDIIMDDYKQSPYHSNASSKTAKQYNDMYKKNTDTSKYMTNAYYVDEDDDVMGAGTNYAGDIESSFLNQFELPTAKNQKIRASNEGREGKNSMGCLVNKWANFSGEGDDMTLGVIDKNAEEFKHNNMHQFNRMRDFADPDYEDNRPLELFTGHSETYVPKREMAPLFKPVKNAVAQDSGLTTLMEERMGDTMGIKRNGDKPFEPKQNAPVLSLDENEEFNAGMGRDTTRIMPRGIDELRRADNQQVTYTEPMMHGKKGNKRPVMPKYEKRKATLLEENRAVYATGGRQAQTSRDDIVMKGRNNRKVTSSVVNPKGGNYKAYDPRFEGQVKHSDKSIYKGQIGGCSGPTQRTQINEKSIILNDTQRMHTHYSVQGNAAGNTRGANISKDEKVRGKHVLENKPNGHAHRGSMGNAAVNFNEKFNGKQILENKPNGHAHRGSMGNAAIDFNMKFNGKQILERGPDGHAHKGSSGHATVNFNEHYHDTIKQQTVAVERPTYINGYTAHKTGMMDPVRRTIKQQTLDTNNGYVAGYNAQNTGMMDPVRRTIKQQTLDTNNGYVAGYNAQNTGMMDPVRRTIKQGTVHNNYQGPLGQHLNQGYLNDTTTAPTTIKETTELHDFIYNPGSSTMNTNNPIDATNITVPFATKQLTLQQNYMGGAGNDNMAMDQSQFYNGNYIEKDLLLSDRAPTTANVNAIPTIASMGQIELPDYQSYDYVGIANNPGNMYNPNANVLTRDYRTYGDNIGQYGVLDKNPYVNTDYFGYK